MCAACSCNVLRMLRKWQSSKKWSGQCLGSGSLGAPGAHVHLYASDMINKYVVSVLVNDSVSHLLL